MEIKKYRASESELNALKKTIQDAWAERMPSDDVTLHADQLPGQETVSWRLDYPDEAQKDGYRRIAVHDAGPDGFNAVIESYWAEQDCEDHQFVPVSHKSGSVFKDGRGQCHRCGYVRPDVLTPDQSSQIAKAGFSREREYPTEQDWRSPETGKPAFLQCGERGIVVSRSTGTCRSTAFFEAFPTVSGYPTFIRGEGETLREAEGKAWKAYQAQLSCPGHEFTRVVNGRQREDGAGECMHCGLFSSKALPPATLCEACSTPTLNNVDGRLLCYTHFFSEVTLEEYVNAACHDEATQHDEKSIHYTSINEVKLDRLFEYRLKKWVLETVCDNDSTLLEKEMHAFDHLALKIQAAFERDILQSHKTGIYPDFENHARPLAERWLSAIENSHEYAELFENALMSKD